MSLWSGVMALHSMAASRSRSHGALLLPPATTALLLLCLGCLLPLAVQGGPCSSSAVSIPVRKPADILLRLKYPATQTVSLELQNNLWLSASLELSSAGFCCTILTSASSAGAKGFTIGFAQSGQFPLVHIKNVSNVLLTRLTLSRGSSTAICDRSQLGLDVGAGNPLPCPAVFAHRAWGITVSHCTLTTRIDFFYVVQARVESSTITLKSDDVGVRIANCGDGPNLIPGKVFVTNNRITGGIEGVLLFKQAVGATVQNNDFLNFLFTGVQCGRGYKNAADCMLSTISYNVMTTDPSFQPLNDASGIYFSTHWSNPGNVVRCNYVIGGRHCVYLDYCSSGITVDGAICVDGYDGIKLNAGHNNVVTSVVAVNLTGMAGWMSSQNYDVNNCNLTPGSDWAKAAPQFGYAYPFLSGFCTRSSVGGVACNPAGGATAAETGRCSGMPTANVMKLSIVDAKRKPPWGSPNFTHYETLPAVPRLNQLLYKNYWTANNVVLYGGLKPPWDNVAFNDPAGKDYGLRSGSVIWQQYDGFRSCPRSQTGAKPIPQSSAFSFFNVARSVPLPQ